MADEKKFQLTTSMRALRHKALVAFRDQIKDMPTNIMFNEDAKAKSLDELNLLIENCPAVRILPPRKPKSSGAADKGKAPAKK